LAARRRTELRSGEAAARPLLRKESAMSNAIRAASYYRMSDDQQQESIPQQRNAVTAWAKAHGYVIVREYMDEGISGDKTEKRKGFLQMREDATRLRDFQAIIVWDQDRFGRFDSLEAGYWIKPLRDAGVVLVTMREGAIDWNDFTKRLVYTITQEGKHQYLRDISRNITRGLLANAKDGKRNGSYVPYAYDRMLLDELGQPRQRLRIGEKVARPASWGVTLVPSDDPAQVETVVWVFRTWIDTATSLRAIALELNRRGIPAPGRFHRPGDRERPLWDTNAIRRLLANPVYCGDYRWGQTASGSYHRVVNGEVTETKGKRCRRANERPAVYVRDAFSPLVSRETWDAAQAKLAERRVNRSYVRDAGYALTGLLYCGHCRMKMKGTHCGCRAANGKVYSYRRYICKTAIANGGAGCRLYSIRESYLLPFLVKRLQEDYLAPEKVAQLEAELRRRLEARRNGGSLAEAEGLRRRLAAVDDEIKTATQNVLRAKSNIDLLNDALTALRGERERLAAELSDAEARRGPELDIEETVKKAVDRLRTLAEWLQEVDPKRLREVLRQIFVRVDLYYESVEGRTKRSPFRLEKGVAQLRPQMQFDSCASSSPRFAACRSASSGR
jgi:DNA invertase Pin-like site-specific DNA recombinase